MEAFISKLGTLRRCPEGNCQGLRFARLNFAIPGKGVVKRNRSQRDFFTIQKAVKPYGYKSLFIYGGESRFDQLGKGWFSGKWVFDGRFCD